MTEARLNMKFKNNMDAKLEPESECVSSSTCNSDAAPDIDGRGKIPVYINPEPIFFDILRSKLNKVDIDVRELAFPKGKIDLLRWAWKLGMSKPEIVHYVGGYHHPIIYIIPKFLGKRVIVHWMGTDVLYATTNRAITPTNLLRRVAYKVVDLHLAVFEPLANELKSMGINARVVPLIPDMALSPEDTTWLSENAILVYLPEGREEFYGGSIAFGLAEELPDLRFLIVGNSGKGMPQLANIEFLGWVNLSTVWKRVKVYLRLTKHDGQAGMVLEALARGKQVIWSYEYPFCHQARTIEQARVALKDILDNNQPNTQAMDWAQRTFDPSKIAQTYRNIYLGISR